MIKLILVTGKTKSWSEFFLGLEKNKDVSFFCTDSAYTALDMLKSRSVDLVISDEELQDMSGLELVKKIITHNAMINCAIVSSLSGENFHEVSEGMGILAQLPVNPGEKDADELISYLKQVIQLDSELEGKSL